MQLQDTVLDHPPRDAASIVVLRDAPDGAPDTASGQAAGAASRLQVLLVRRHANSRVLGGAYVFPGGKLDAADADPQALACLSRLPEQVWPRLNEPALPAQQAAALYIAAAREAFEETGLLFHCTGSLARSWMAPDALARHPGENFAALLARLGCILDADALLPWSRWITPRQPTVMSQRFDTRFFLAAAPAAQTARHDGHEITELLWLHPREALARYRDHAIDLAPPQIISLAHLARFATTAQALQDARQRPPPLIDPEPLQDRQGQRLLCYPGDPCHSNPCRALPVPTRLRYTNGRFLPEGGFDAFFA